MVGSAVVGSAVVGSSVLGTAVVGWDVVGAAVLHVGSSSTWRKPTAGFVITSVSTRAAPFRVSHDELARTVDPATSEAMSPVLCRLYLLFTESSVRFIRDDV